MSDRISGITCPKCGKVIDYMFDGNFMPSDEQLIKFHGCEEGE